MNQKNRKRSVLLLSISFAFLFTATAVSSAAPTTMPTIAGQIGDVKKSLTALGFTKPLIVLQQTPPTKAYSCRPVADDDFVIHQDPASGAPVTADSQITLTTVCHLTTPQNAVVKTPFTPPKSSKSNKNSNTQITIACVKGKSQKKVTGVKPSCPKGYSKK